MKAYRLLSTINLFHRFLAGPTGGLAYHAAAFQYRDNLWRPFIDDVEKWLLREVLQKWQPVREAFKTRELIIFGPSAGWTLSAKFLENFDRVICVEPDPFARLLFRLRFRRIKKLTFEKRSDLLPWFARDRSPQMIGCDFEKLLAKYPSAAILFSNLLGQIQLLIDKPNASFNERAQRAFIKGLEGRLWASYHDVVSTRLVPKANRLTTAPSANINDLVEMNFENNPDQFATDHETEWLRATRTSIWQIRPGVYHLVGFIDSSDFVKSISADRPLGREIRSPKSDLRHSPDL